MWFGSALPLEESQLPSGGNLPPVWEPQVWNVCYTTKATTISIFRLVQNQACLTEAHIRKLPEFNFS